MSVTAHEVGQRLIWTCKEVQIKDLVSHIIMGDIYYMGSVQLIRQPMAQGAESHITVKFRRQFSVGKVPAPMFGMRALHLFFIKMDNTINTKQHKHALSETPQLPNPS